MMSDENLAESEQATTENELEFSSVEELGQSSQEDKGETTQTETQEEKRERLLAGKFKSAEELEEAYQNLEKEKSRLGNEVGDLRQKIDQFIVPQLQAQQNQSQQSQETDNLSEDDFWENPQKATSKLVQNALKEELEPIKQEFSQTKAEKAVEKLKSEHPDYLDVYNNSDFQEWVRSSNVRARMLQEADQNADADTASEILSLYKQTKGMGKKADNNNNEQPSHDRESLQQASVESTRSQKANSQKIYRRADIIDLMQNNPERYEQLADEITQAYAEGRVK